jgi:hypothetical protein
MFYHKECRRRDRSETDANIEAENTDAENTEAVIAAEDMIS